MNFTEKLKNKDKEIQEENPIRNGDEKMSPISRD